MSSPSCRGALLAIPLLLASACAGEAGTDTPGGTAQPTAQPTATATATAPAASATAIPVTPTATATRASTPAPSTPTAEATPTERPRTPRPRTPRPQRTPRPETPTPIHTPTAIPTPTATPIDCDDGDRDGYGFGSECLGLDCDDSDAAQTTECACETSGEPVDSFEPDDCWWRGHPLTPDVTEERSLGAGGDEDWSHFPGEATHNFEVIVVGTTGLRIYVYRQNFGSDVYKDFDLPGSITVDGRFADNSERLLKVKGYYEADTGPYTVTYHDLGPNDHGTSQEDATLLIPDGSSVDGHWETSNTSTDWFRVDGVAGTRYSITLGSELALTVHLEVMRADGGLVAIREKPETLTYVHTPSSTEPFYLLASREGSGRGTYSISVSILE